MAKNTKKNLTEETKTEETKTEKKVGGVTKMKKTAVPETDAPETNDAEVAEVNERKEILDEINSLVAQYNDASEYGEAKRMKKLEDKIGEKVKDYATASEDECFAALLKTENPMLEAARQHTFPTVRIKDNDDAGFVAKEVEPSCKAIDPLKLHKRAKGGIGADKKWMLYVEKLTYLLTARKAIEFGLDPREITKNMAISDEALKVEALMSEDDPAKYNKNEADEVLVSDIQKIVEAMIGKNDDWEVEPGHASWLLSVFASKNNKRALGAIAATAPKLRAYVFEICHGLVTGLDIELLQKKK